MQRNQRLTASLDGEFVMWTSRTSIMVQYWRSMEQLLGMAGRLEPAVGGKQSAAGRLGRRESAP